MKSKGRRMLQNLIMGNLHGLLKSQRRNELNKTYSMRHVSKADLKCQIQKMVEEWDRETIFFRKRQFWDDGTIICTSIGLCL